MTQVYFSDFYPAEAGTGIEGSTLPSFSRSRLETILNTLEGVTDDAVLSRDEKLMILIPLVDEITANYNSSISLADDFNIDPTNVTEAFTAFINYLNSLVPAWDDTTQNTGIDRVIFRTKTKAALEAINDVDNLITLRLRESVDAAIGQIEDISSDAILSMNEKSDIIRQYNVLIGEQTGLVAQASALNITTELSNYNSSISSVTTYLNSLSPAWDNVTANTPINAVTFRNVFINAYLAKTALQTKIDNMLKFNIDEANARVNAISSDSILSASEKPEVIRLYDSIVAKAAVLRPQAVNLSISITAYDQAVNDMNSYLEGLIPNWSNATVDTPIVAGTFRQIFSNVFIAQEAVQVAVTNKLKDDVNIALGKITEISSDNVLSSGEKSEIITQHATINNEYINLSNQGINLGLSSERDTYAIAIGNLNNYLNTLTPTWNNVNVNTPIVGSTFRSYFSAIYVARTNLQVAIANKLKSDIDLALTKITNIANDNILSAGEKPEIIRLYDSIVAKATALRPQAVTLGLSVFNYDQSIDLLNSYLNSLSPSWASTTTDTLIDGTVFRSRFNGVFIAQEAVQVAVTNKLKTDIDVALAEITNISSDQVLSKGEKSEVVRTWQSLAATYNTLRPQALNYGLSVSTYDTAINNLGNYLNSLNPPWGDATTNTPIVGETFRAQFEAVIIAQTNMQNAISNYINGRVTAALDRLTEIASDGIITPGEKHDLIRQYDSFNGEYPDLSAKASALGITTELQNHAYSIAGGGGYTGINPYLGSLTTPVPWNNLTGNTNVNGATLRELFGFAYATKTALITKMASLDPATRINQGTVTINGGRLTANSVSSAQLTINNRNISVIQCEFKYESGVLSWSTGYVLYTNDAGTLTASSISGGAVTWAGGGYNYIYWPQGATQFYQGVDNWDSIMAGSNIIMCSWYLNTSNIVANYGGTIIHGDKIVTGSITADRLNVNQLSAITANIGDITAGIVRSPDFNNYIDITNGRSQFAKDGYAFRTGNLGSGVLMWFGPNAIGSLSETRTNGVWSFGTDGKVYYGTGELSSGGSTVIIKTATAYGDTGSPANVPLYQGALTDFAIVPAGGKFTIECDLSIVASVAGTTRAKAAIVKYTPDGNAYVTPWITMSTTNTLEFMPVNTSALNVEVVNGSAGAVQFQLQVEGIGPTTTVYGTLNGVLKMTYVSS